MEKETRAGLWYTCRMSTPKPRSPRDWREGRQLRAWALHQQGWTGTAIAQALGVTKGAVSRWLKRAREGGAEALYRQPPPGHSRLAATLTGYHVALPKDLCRPPVTGTNAIDAA